jgi:predicted nucleic acid-binding protein
MPFAIIDTNVYVDHWEGVLENHVLDRIRTRFVVRQSSVVLSELRRGARTSQARRLVEALQRLSKVQWTPASADWWHAGLIIQRIGDGRNWDARKRQEFQNDTLIALSARRYGATVVTSNYGDFELLAKQLKIPVLWISGDGSVNII